MICEPRVLLTADYNFMTRVDTPTDGFVSSPVIFLTTPGSSVTFSGATLGTLTSTGGGAFHYIPNQGAMGVDHIVAHFQQPPSTGMMGMMTQTSSYRTIDMTIFMPAIPQDDDSYEYLNPVSNQTSTVNYFALKGNTLTVAAKDGVLKNDSDPDIFQYLTATQIGNGDYGSFSISSSGAFTYTPNGSIFDSPLFGDMGLTDSCEYYVTDQLGNNRGMAIVEVDLAKMILKLRQATGNNNIPYSDSIVDSSTISQRWVGEDVFLTTVIQGQVPNIRTYMWTVPGKDANGFTIADDFTSGMHPTVPEYDNPAIRFYWYEPSNGGPKTVNVSMTTVGGQQATDSTQFSVSTPDVQVTSTLGSIRRVRNPISTIVSLGSDSTPGITLEADVTGRGGSPLWVQTVTYQIIAEFASVQVDPAFASGIGHEYISHRTGLDSRSTGNAANPIEPAFQPDRVLTDSPQFPLPNNAGVGSRYSYTASFTAHLLWKSSQPESEWVPLATVDWGMHVELYAIPRVNNSGNPDLVDWVFTALPPSDEKWCQPFVRTTDYPEWHTLVDWSNLLWEPIC